MAWEKEVVESVRVLIGDLDEPVTYTDVRIERLSIIAANHVVGEIEFDNTYVVDISQCSITPDPADLTVVSAKDNMFMTLVALKVACIIATSDLKRYARIGGFSVNDGPSSIDTKSLFANYNTVAKKFCDDYNFLKLNYKMLACDNNIQAILTATTNRSIYGDLSPLPY